MKLLANFLKHEHNITWLYDMDIVFGLDGNFDEPGNLLVNADCELKICDFGLAHGFNQAQKQGFMTEYVATRWYRAPELMLSFANYVRLGQLPVSPSSCEVRLIFSSFFCVLFGRPPPSTYGPLGVFWMSFWLASPSLKGKNEGSAPQRLLTMPNGLDSYVDQLNQILHYLGTPRVRCLKNLMHADVTCAKTDCPNQQAQDYIHSLPIRPCVPFAQMFPHVNPLALDLLTKMLNFDPAKRIACEQVLERPYLAIWHDPTDEAICPAKFDLFFEEEDSIEVNLFRSEVRTTACSNQNRQLTIPFRNDIVASLIRDDAPLDGATSCYYSGHTLQQGIGHRPASPVIDDPSAELERELAGTHIGRQ
ncbi:CMGC/MAPK/ERK protein kinase [Russula earlei]|uniref:CMGC/MAPK/ERK protein kinase n=1 Tax=Russula earlei TaxID=71964 RepID=A0ACC0TRI4_9AGAM|nr:CMGC/MAPK/ERK protein kinase [Russula earlei]